MYDLDYFAENLERPKRGKDYVLGLCVYHDDHDPSLCVYIRTQHYECFSCGATGSLGKLARDLGGSFGVALGGPVERVSWRDRPGWNNIGLETYCSEAHQRLLSLTQTHWYLDDRGLAEGIQPYGLGWDNGWYIVPVRTSSGSVEGAIARAGPGAEEKTQMRFDMPLGQSPILYIPDHELWAGEEVVYVTFGVFDAISLALCGLASASPTAGKKSVDAVWFDDVDKRIVVVPDRDESVDAHYLAMGLDYRGMVHHVDYQGIEKDPNDVLVKRGVDGLKRAILAGGSD